MVDIIYTFGIGISFALGIGIGAYLCRLAILQGRKDVDEGIVFHNKMVESRLKKYVEHTDRIASALEKLIDK